MSVSYLAVGHLAKDLTPDGSRLGGTVAYATLTARALGYPAGIATAYEAGLDVSVLVEAGIHLTQLPSELTTTFENIYGAEGRVQFLRARAEPLTALAIPIGWRKANILHFAPLAQEIEPDLVASLA